VQEAFRSGDVLVAPSPGVVRSHGILFGFMVAGAIFLAVSTNDAGFAAFAIGVLVLFLYYGSRKYTQRQIEVGPEHTLVVRRYLPPRTFTLGSRSTVSLVRYAMWTEYVEVVDESNRTMKVTSNRGVGRLFDYCASVPGVTVNRQVRDTGVTGGT
jgi:hypothetical protein